MLGLKAFNTVFLFLPISKNVTPFPFFMFPLEFGSNSCYAAKVLWVVLLALGEANVLETQDSYTNIQMEYCTRQRMVFQI